MSSHMTSALVGWAIISQVCRVPVVARGWCTRLIETILESRHSDSPESQPLLSEPGPRVECLVSCATSINEGSSMSID